MKSSDPRICQFLYCVSGSALANLPEWEFARVLSPAQPVRVISGRLSRSPVLADPPGGSRGGGGTLAPASFGPPVIRPDLPPVQNPSIHRTKPCHPPSIVSVKHSSQSPNAMNLDFPCDKHKQRGGGGNPLILFYSSCAVESSGDRERDGAGLQMNTNKFAHERARLKWLGGGTWSNLSNRKSCRASAMRSPDCRWTRRMDSCAST